METEITLDTIILNQMGSYSRFEFGNLLTVIYDKSLDKYGIMNPDSLIKAEQIKNIALKFSAIYLAAASELTRRLVFEKKQEAELVNLVACYIACQGIIQLNRDGCDSMSLENKLVSRKNPDYSEIDFKKMDTIVIDSILRGYCDFMTKGSSSSNLTLEANYFFYGMSKILAKLALREKYGKYKELLEELVVKGPNFGIVGIKELSPKKRSNDAFMNGDEQFKKDFDSIKLTTDRYVYRNQIVGNEEAITKLESAVKKLMAYHKTSRYNPFLDGMRRRGFKQGLLFLGDTGTGKTLVAYYGMTLADTIAKNYGRDLEIVKFNILSSYQEGGVQMLKHQLNLICNGCKIYYVFLDEIDTVFASRSDSSSNSHYHRQKLGELMRFLDGDYPNLGNYLVVATANDPVAVDRALKNARLERIYCSGPLTPEEKAKVLAIHFGDDINNGVVLIDNWRKIGEIVHQADLNGRQLREVVNNCYDKAANLSDQQYAAIYSANTYQASRSLISKALVSITENMVIDEIMDYGKKDMEEVKSVANFFR